MMELIITRRDQSRHVVLYDEVDAELVNRHQWRMLSVGYASTNISMGGRVVTLLLHRMILGLVPGDRRQGDHINGNKLDNRRENLRIVTLARNVANQRVINGRGTSRYRGVSWNTDRQRWVARVNIDKRTHQAGYFASEEEAAVAVAELRREHGLPAGY